MKSQNRMHWMPPQPSHHSVLDRRDFTSALPFVSVLSIASIAAQAIAGTMTTANLVGIPLGTALAASAIASFSDDGLSLMLTRDSWWGMIGRAARYGVRAMLCALAVLFFSGSSDLGDLAFSTALNALAIGPVSAWVQLARMRDSHERRYPLTGEGGELEA